MFSRLFRSTFTKTTSKTPFSTFTPQWFQSMPQFTKSSIKQSTQFQHFTFPFQLPKYHQLYILPAFGALNAQQNTDVTDKLLRDMQFAEMQEVEANPQERAILTQLVERYGIDSEECKEFALTTSDLTPADEVRMLSPCGIHYTSSIYYSVLYHRFDIPLGDEKARHAGIEYEKCLIERSSEEYHFWSKTREIAQISAGFVQNAMDHHERQLEEEAKIAKNSEIENTKQQNQALEKIAEGRVD